MRSLRLLSLAAASAVALFSAPSRSDEPKPLAKKDDPPLKLPTEAEIMRMKLKHAQILIDAITREDFKQVDAQATALLRISNGAQFLNARKTDEYAFQAHMFRETVSRMADRAKARNLDGVILAFHEMSTRCFRCHQYTRTPKRD